MAIKDESPNFAQTRSQVAHHTRIERQPKRRRERERERERGRENTEPLGPKELRCLPWCHLKLVIEGVIDVPNGLGYKIGRLRMSATRE
jgi:hypothetical protein